LLLLWFRRGLITLILFYSVVHRSIPLVFSEYNTHLLESCVTQQRSGSSSPTSTELLKQLHWLPIEWHIRLKLATLTFKALHTGHTPYLADLLQYHKTTKSTRSSASHLLSVPRHNLSFGSRAFLISAPKIWNSLPPHILQSQTLDSFRRHLKTYRPTFSQPILPL